MYAKVNEDGLNGLELFLDNVSRYDKVLKIEDTETSYSDRNLTRYKIGEYWFYEYEVDLFPKEDYPEMYL